MAKSTHAIEIRQPQHKEMVVESHEYIRLVLENQRMVTLLARVLEMDKAGQRISASSAMMMAMNKTVAEVNNPMMIVGGVPVNGDGSYAEIMTARQNTPETVAGIPVLLHPTMPDNEIWISNPTMKQLIKAKIGA